MFKRFLMVFSMLILAVAGILLVARHPTGPNTVSYDEPLGLWISLGMIIVLFLPPLILSLFSNRTVRIISAVYQAFIVMAFLGVIPIGFLFPVHVWVSVIAVLGTLVSLASIVLTLRTTSSKDMTF